MPPIPELDLVDKGQHEKGELKACAPQETGGVNCRSDGGRIQPSTLFSLLPFLSFPAKATCDCERFSLGTAFLPQVHKQQQQCLYLCSADGSTVTVPVFINCVSLSQDQLMAP